MNMALSILFCELWYYDVIACIDEQCEEWYGICACVRWEYDPSKLWYDDVVSLLVDYRSLFLMHDGYVNMSSLDLVDLGTLVMHVYEWMKK